METPTTETTRNEVQIAVMTEKISNIEKTTTRIDTTLNDLNVSFTKRFVTREQFAPIRALVYGFAGLILTAFVLGMVYLLINKP